MTAEQTEATEDLIRRMFLRLHPGGKPEQVRRLSGGASQESWLFTGADADGNTREYVMRRAPGGDAALRERDSGLMTEAKVIAVCERHGVPVPRVVHQMDAQDALGPGFVMVRVYGETIARKILRDDEFANVRPHLAFKAGEVLAKIGSVPIDELPELPAWRGRARLEAARESYEKLGHRRAVFEYALRWLEERIPADPPALKLVHGDFRNGNLMIDANGISAVLDWEVVHLGDPLEDLGWLCTPSWRFGEIDKAAGGLGTVDQLIEGFESAGGAKVDRSLLQFWTVFGSLNWGTACTMFANDFRLGDRTVERGSIGRRISECEMDIMMLTREKDGVLV